MKLVVWLLIITGFAVLVLSAQQKEVKKIPVTSTRADSAIEMFKTYCASCHGVDGKGHGSAADALNMPPADLTVLKQENSGKFPASKLTRVVDGADRVPAHGSSEMPTWGPIFHSLDPNNAAVTTLRIANLTKYIESLQQ